MHCSVENENLKKCVCVSDGSMRYGWSIEIFTMMRFLNALRWIVVYATTKCQWKQNAFKVTVYKHQIEQKNGMASHGTKRRVR